MHANRIGNRNPSLKYTLVGIVEGREGEGRERDK